MAQAARCRDIDSTPNEAHAAIIMPQPVSPIVLTPLPEDFDMAALDAAIREEILSLWPDEKERGKRVQGALLWKERLLQEPSWRLELMGPPKEAAMLLGRWLTSRVCMIFPPD